MGVYRAAVERHYTFLVNAVIFGVIYFSVMCATRHHGGAHLNPAITIASSLSGITGALQAVVFIVVQVRCSLCVAVL